MINTNEIIQLASYTIPSLITGGVAYYLFSMHLKSDDNRRRYLLHREAQKNALPLRLQSYERMTLFLERINISKILVRIAPISTNKTDYANLVTQHIEQEFEHNLTQQIYMSDETWRIISTTKNSIIQLIRKSCMDPEIKDANQLREMLLSNTISTPSPTIMAIEILKKEVTELW